MKTIADLRQNIVLSIYVFKDLCATLGQNGIVSACVADALKETLTDEQIEHLIYHLKRK